MGIYWKAQGTYNPKSQIMISFLYWERPNSNRHSSNIWCLELWPAELGHFR